MIKGFKTETHTLTDKEREILTILINGLNSMSKGSKYKKPAQYFIDKLLTVGVDIKEVRFRKLIQYIRVNDLVLGICSDNRGYWICDNKEDLMNTLLSLRDRIHHQTATFNALKRQYTKLYDKPADSRSNNPLFKE